MNFADTILSRFIRAFSLGRCGLIESLRVLSWLINLIAPGNIEHSIVSGETERKGKATLTSVKNIIANDTARLSYCPLLFNTIHAIDRLESWSARTLFWARSISAIGQFLSVLTSVRTYIEADIIRQVLLIQYMFAQFKIILHDDIMLIQTMIQSLNLFIFLFIIFI